MAAIVDDSREAFLLLLQLRVKYLDRYSTHTYRSNFSRHLPSRFIFLERRFIGVLHVASTNEILGTRITV